MLSPLAAFLKAVETHPDKVYLRQPIKGVYHEMTWQQCYQASRNVAYQLTKQGVSKGDRVALWSKNCAEWILADIAIMMVGAVSVPLYPGQSKENVHYVLEHSEAKLIFVGKHDNDAEVVTSLPENPPSIGFKYYSGNTLHDWNQWATTQAPDDFKIHDPAMNEMMTIIYTSGTTGQPKGAVHTYHSYAFASNNFVDQLKLTIEERCFSFLPLAHVAERILVEGQSLYAWFPVSFAESLDTFADNLSSVRPTLFFAVPRLWAKFQEGIIAKVGSDEKLQKLLKIPLLSWLIKRKIQKGLGLDQARQLGCGASPMPRNMLDWFDRLGMPIMEGYGMTESLSVGAFNTPDSLCFGSVGKPFEQNKVRISEEGEIQFKTEALMQGYYQAPDKTAEVMVDGYYRTGDKGHIDENGFLHITGRVKELFKTSKGKYIAPAPLEALLTAHPMIDQACIMGSGMPQPVVVIELSDLARSKSKEVVEAEVQKHIGVVNRKVEHHERIAQVLITQLIWTIESGLITPTLKIRREQVEGRYLQMLEGQPDQVLIWGPEETEGSATQAA